MRNGFNKNTVYVPLKNHVFSSAIAYLFIEETEDGFLVHRSGPETVERKIIAYNKIGHSENWREQEEYSEKTIEELEKRLKNNDGAIRRNVATGIIQNNER